MVDRGPGGIIAPGVLDTLGGSCKMGDMTNTDTNTDTPQYSGTPQPSANYDGCLTAAAIDQCYKDLMSVMLAADPSPAERKRLTTELQEDHRRAHVRLVGGKRTRGTSTPRTVVKPADVIEGDVPSILCQGPCGEIRPTKKFPTLAKGGRGTVCRDCAKALRDAKKNGG